MRKLLVFLLLCCPVVFVFAKVNVDKSSAIFQISAGASFVAESAISGFKGKLVKDNGGTISGSIGFEDGEYEESGNKVKLTGDLELDGAYPLTLNGNKSFKGVQGYLVKKLKVSGVNNRLEGILQLKENIVLQDSTSSVTCAVQGRIPCNIETNGGTVFLEDDLHFVDDMFFTGSGIIKLNKRNLLMGSTEMTTDASLYFDNAQDIELNANLHLDERWTFSGSSIIEGKGKILYLEENGEIVVERGSSLLLRDVTIRKISGNNIRCLDGNSILTFQNVSWIQDGNYSFTTGALEVVEKCYFRGGYEFALQSIQTSTIRPYAKMIFESGMTFSFDPIYSESMSDWTDAQKLLDFEDSTAVLELRGATLHVTTTGMQLLKGEVSIKDDCSFASESTVSSEGIILGDGVSSGNDVEVTFAPDARLRVTSGHLVDKNVD